MFDWNCVFDHAVDSHCGDKLSLFFQAATPFSPTDETEAHSTKYKQ